MDPRGTLEGAFGFTRRLPGDDFALFLHTIGIHLDPFWDPWVALGSPWASSGGPGRPRVHSGTILDPFLIRFGGPLGVRFWSILDPIFGPISGHFLSNF